MSTRSQVRIESKDYRGETRAFTLYHHCDGYPEYMLPCLVEAWNLARERHAARDWGDRPFDHQFHLGRVEKVAAMICAADPDGFDCLPYNDLHGDIEFLYVVRPEAREGEDDTFLGYQWTVTARMGRTLDARIVDQFVLGAGLSAAKGREYMVDHFSTLREPVEAVSRG